MITFVQDIDLRALSSVHSDKREYLTLYLPVGGPDVHHENEIFIQRRLRDLNKILSGVDRSRLERTIEMIAPMIEEDPAPLERGRIFFANVKGLESFSIPVEVDRKLVWDSSPYLLPLAVLKEEYRPYGMVLIDSRTSFMYLIRSEVCSTIEESSIDLMNKHKKGGMSQRRFQRLREGAIDHFLKKVVKDMGAFLDVEGIMGIIITGPGESKKRLVEMLTPDLSSKVISVIDSEMDPSCGRLVKEGDPIVSAVEMKEEGKALEEFKECVLKDEGGVYGFAEVREALEAGRVDTFLVRKGLKVPGWKCESCQNLHEGLKVPGSCPRCGSGVIPIDYVEELFELAERMRSKVEFVGEDPFLDSVGGVGAILRY